AAEHAWQAVLQVLQQKPSTQLMLVHWFEPVHTDPLGRRAVHMPALHQLPDAQLLSVAHVMVHMALMHRYGEQPWVVGLLVRQVPVPLQRRALVSVVVLAQDALTHTVPAAY